MKMVCIFRKCMYFIDFCYQGSVSAARHNNTVFTNIRKRTDPKVGPDILHSKIRFFLTSSWPFQQWNSAFSSAGSPVETL